MAAYLTMDPEGLVQNLIIWNGVDEMPLPEGWTMAELGLGEYYEFGKPRGIDPPPAVEPHDDDNS